MWMTCARRRCSRCSIAEWRAVSTPCTHFEPHRWRFEICQLEFGQGCSSMEACGPSTIRESSDMSTAVIRFAGRFLFARPSSPSSSTSVPSPVHVVGANVTFNPLISDCPHRTFVTAPFGSYQHGRGKRPDARIVVQQGTPDPLEFAIWDLAGLHLELPDVSGGASWGPCNCLPGG